MIRLDAENASEKIYENSLRSLNCTWKMSTKQHFRKRNLKPRKNQILSIRIYSAVKIWKNFESPEMIAIVQLSYIFKSYNSRHKWPLPSQIKSSHLHNHRNKSFFWKICLEYQVFPLLLKLVWNTAGKSHIKCTLNRLKYHSKDTSRIHYSSEVTMTYRR